MSKVEVSPKIQKRSVDSLIPYARNSRTHNDEQVAQIAASIKEFGFTNPILVDGNNGIIAGHGRLQAARKLGLTEVPVIELAHLTEIQKQAYIIADNKLALNAGWDTAMLGLELSDLKLNEFDLDVIGFDAKELDELLQKDGEIGLTDEDEVPEAPEKPVTLTGDIWNLGNHRIVCGDSTQITDVERLMAGQMADLIFTDPPYGVAFERGKFVGREKAAKGGKFAPIANDELTGEGLIEFIRSVFAVAFTVTKDCAFYCWSPSLRQGAEIYDGIIKAGWKIQSQIIWRKSPFVIGRCDYHWQHEVCWYGFKEGQTHAWYGGRDKATVWDVPKAQKVDLHPTMKPVELGVKAIENSSKGGDIILDLFGGSGSTLMACEKLGRRGYLMELEPKYVDVIVKRWQDFTGKAATLEATGQTFEQLNKERLDG